MIILLTKREPEMSQELQAQLCKVCWMPGLGHVTGQGYNPSMLTSPQILLPLHSANPDLHLDPDPDPHGLYQSQHLSVLGQYYQVGDRVVIDGDEACVVATQRGTNGQAVFGVDYHDGMTAFEVGWSVICMRTVCVCVCVCV